jgi:K+-sensing histidine kinase KdpD
MTHQKLPLQFAHSVVPRYGLAVAWVAIALAIAFFLENHEFHRGALPLFLLAVALSAWYGGVGPAMLAIVLSILSFDYYFAPPVHSLNFTFADVPSFLFLLTFGALIAGFSAVRRRVEAELLQARDKLEIEIAARTQQASLLNLTHDTIFVRDMQEVITYWNRGA